MLMAYSCIIGYKYVWLFDRACGVSFIYNKNKSCSIVDLVELHNLFP